MVLGRIEWWVVTVAGSWRGFDPRGQVGDVVLILVLMPVLLPETAVVLEAGFEAWRGVSELICFCLGGFVKVEDCAQN